jgi:hypothetical protein
MPRKQALLSARRPCAVVIAVKTVLLTSNSGQHMIVPDFRPLLSSLGDTMGMKGRLCTKMVAVLDDLPPLQPRSKEG